MSAMFTDDDLEKTVENESGEVIGTVTSVEDDTARVEPRAGLVDSIRAALGWSGGHEETVAINEDAVDEISSETIRLETAAASDPSTDEPADIDRAASPSSDIDDTTGSASRAEDEPANAAERDSDAELAEEMGRTARRDTIDEGEDATGNAAERTAEPADRSSEEPEPSGADDAQSETTTRPAEPSMIDDPDIDESVETPDEPEMGEPIDAPGDPELDESTDASADSDPIEPTGGTDDSTADESIDAPDDSDASDGIDTSETPGGIETTEPLETDESGTEGESGMESTSETRREPDIGDEPDTVSEGDTERDPDAEAADTRAPLDEMSGTRDGDAPGEMDRAGAQNTPVGEAKSAPDHAEMGAPADADLEDDTSRENEADGGDITDSAAESAASDSSDDASEPATEETDLAGELDTGIDIETAVAPGDDEQSDDADRTESDSSDDADVGEAVDTGLDLESAAESTADADREAASSGTEPTDLADAVDTGVDIESVATGDAESRSDARPETELDPDVDARSGPEADPRPETALESAESTVGDAATRDDSPTADERQAPTDVVPGVDLESAIDADEDAGSEPGIDPETLAGRETDPEPAGDEVARERVDDEVGTDDAEMAASDQSDRPGSSLAAVVAAQRAAMTGGQELVKQGLAAQQAAARAAVETPLRMQRQGLEATQAATSGYFDVVGTLLGGGTGSDCGASRSMDETIADLEDAHANLPADEFEQQLTVHLELLRSMRAQLEETVDATDSASGANAEAVEASDEIAGDLLERQIAILEACQQRLADDTE